MKAVLCRRFGTIDDLELADIAAPQAGPGEAVVRVKAAALNFFDTLIIAGKYQHKPPFPFSPAAEFSGVVESVGPGVTTLAPGDRVMGNIGWGAAREAVAVAADIVSEIGRLAREYEEGPLDPRFTPPYSTLHVGMIRGGTARNILARECVLHWEFRGLPGASTASAMAKVQAFVDAVATPRLTRFVSGPAIATTIEVDVPPLAAAPGSAAERLALRLTRSNQTIAVSFASEAGHFQAAGLPTIVCGPGSIDQAHKPDEFVDEAQLAACLEFLQRLADDLAR